MPEVSVGENSIGTQAWITARTKPEALTCLQVPAAGLCISGRCRGLCPPPPQNQHMESGPVTGVRLAFPSQPWWTCAGLTPRLPGSFPSGLFSCGGKDGGLPSLLAIGQRRQHRAGGGIPVQGLLTGQLASPSFLAECP